MIQFGIRGTAVAFLACAVAFAGAQTPQSLQDLVRIARARNGTILASKEQVAAAASSVDRSRAGFFPTLTPNFQYDLARDERHTGNGRGGFDTAGTTLNVVARYLILDNGARRLGLSTSQLNLSSAEANALQTERSTITAVTQRVRLLMLGPRLVSTCKRPLNQPDAKPPRIVPTRPIGCISS